MVRESIVRVAAVATVLLVGGLGCQTTQETKQQAPETGSEWSESPTPSTPSTETQPIGKLQTVYFDFDKSEIRPDARETLKRDASLIGQMSGTITIQGNCDERGSAEYNLALGERRANAVKRYLVDLGVPSSRLRTVSFGEDRPAVQGHDESAWRYNRRADFAK